VTAVRRFIDSELDDPFRPREELPQDGSTHRLLVVTGSDGVTEIAVNLASRLAELGRATVLVDLDTAHPSIAQRLDLPILPNLLIVSDHIRNSRFGPDSVVHHASGLDVIPGLANPREWNEFSLVDAGELIDGLSEHYVLIVAVVHSLLEDLAPLSGLEGRFDVGRHIVEKADEVLITATGSPTGMVRTLTTISDVRALTMAPIHVVVNRMPSDGFMRSEWSRELERTFTPTSISFLPIDQGIPRAAWDGRLLDRGRFAKAIGQMSTNLVAGWT
jgi:MinD-like ATPase involved in chromosome partitioning or flagellar assembly